MDFGAALVVEEGAVPLAFEEAAGPEEEIFAQDRLLLFKDRFGGLTKSG